jgi:hypothetical protein
MKKPAKFLFVLVAVVLPIGTFLARAGSDSQGPYLGQKPPGTLPELFAPGIVSTGLYERDVAVSPDGREIIFGVIWGKVVTIMSSRLEGGEWTTPEVVPFALDFDYFHFFAAAKRTALDRWKGKPMAFPDLRGLAAVPQNGLADIYWVDTRVIEELEKSVRKPIAGE